MNTRSFLAGLAIGLAPGLFFAVVPHASADPGDTEDSPSWSCVLDGNHVCGPGNEMGAVPGLYRDGALVQSWPTVRTCQTLVITSCTETYVAPALVHLDTMAVA